MKTNMTIKNLLLVGIVSLTLASCGGGGGGGSSSGKGSSAHKPSTQHGLAPYNLSGCTMTYTYNGKPYTFTFGDSGEVNGVWENGSFTTNYDGSYTYSRSADGSSASLNMYTTSGTNSLGFSDSQTFNIKLAFSSTTQATARVDYVNKESYNGNALPNDKELEYTTTATFSGSGVLDNSTSEGESNDDSFNDDSSNDTSQNDEEEEKEPELAPENGAAFKVLKLNTTSGYFTFGSGATVTFGGVTYSGGSYSYTKTGPDQAVISIYSARSYTARGYMDLSCSSLRVTFGKNNKVSVYGGYTIDRSTSFNKLYGTFSGSGKCTITK